MCPPRAFKKIFAVNQGNYVYSAQREVEEEEGRARAQECRWQVFEQVVFLDARACLGRKGREKGACARMPPARISTCCLRLCPRGLLESEEGKTRAQDCRGQEFLYVVFAYAHVACRRAKREGRVLKNAADRNL